MGFSVAWNIRDRNTDTELVNSPTDTYWCRDSAYYTMTRVLYDKFTRACGLIQAPTYGVREVQFTYAWRHWCIGYAATALDYTVSFAMIPARTDFESRDYTQDRTERQIKEVIPRIVQELAPRYPTVEFLPFTRMPAFGDAVLHGIELRGDLAVIPAFYWSGYYQRSLSVKDKIPEVLAPESYTRDHVEAWQRVLNGTEIHGMYMLALLGGPVVSNSQYSPNLVPDSIKTGPWFDVKELK